MIMAKSLFVSDKGTNTLVFDDFQRPHCCVCIALCLLVGLPTEALTV